MITKRNLLVIFVSLLLAALFVAPSAQAAWTNQTLTTDNVRPIFASNGSSLESAWSTYTGSYNWGTGVNTLEYTTWHSAFSNGSFSSPASFDNKPVTDFAIGADGTAARVYTESVGAVLSGTTTLKVKIRPAGSSVWSDAYSLDSWTIGSRMLNAIKVVVSSNGGVLVYAANDANNYFYYKGINDAAFATHTFSALPFVQATVDANGRITVASHDGTWSSIVTATLEAGAEQFSAPVQLGCQSCDSVSNPVLTIDSNNRVVIAWMEYQYSGNTTTATIKTAIRGSTDNNFVLQTIVSGDSSWDDNGNLTGTGYGFNTESTSSLVASPDGAVALAWSSSNNTENSYKVSYLASNQNSWAAPEVYFLEPHAFYQNRTAWVDTGHYPAVAAGPNGAVTVATTVVDYSSGGPQYSLQTSTRDSAASAFTCAGTVFSTPVDNIGWQGAYYVGSSPVITYFYSGNGTNNNYATFDGNAASGVCQLDGGGNPPVTNTIHYQSDQNADGQVDPQTTATSSQLHLDVLAAIELSDLSNDSDAAAPVEGGTDNSVVFQSSGGLRSNLGWGITNSATTEGGDSSLNGGASGADAALASPIVYEQADSTDSGLRNQDNDAQSYDAAFSQAISWGDEAGNYQISITHTAAQALVG